MTTQGAHRGGRNRRRALVTGGAGFIGSHLVDRLISEDIPVLVVDDLSTGRLDNVNAQARFERLDISVADLEPVIRHWRPTLVFHLAAQASVPGSMADPLRDLAVNVIGTHRVAATARRMGAERLVFVSSGGAVYGETARPATERTCPAPTSYYGVHKLAAEGHISLAGLPYAIARPSNVYGPRQHPGPEGAVVAAFLEQAVRDGGLIIHGSGRQTRDFIHIRDAVEALWRLGIDKTQSGIWNVASDHETSIADLADMVERSVGMTLGRTFGVARPGDVTRSAISARRLEGLGWKVRVGLSTGIAELARVSP